MSLDRALDVADRALDVADRAFEFADCVLDVADRVRRVFRRTVSACPALVVCPISVILGTIGEKLDTVGGSGGVGRGEIPPTVSSSSAIVFRLSPTVRADPPMLCRISPTRSGSSDPAVSYRDNRPDPQTRLAGSRARSAQSWARSAKSWTRSARGGGGPDDSGPPDRIGRA
ncbi:hypothetical protein EEB19_01325 [Gordonia sp. OPL2]|nr:hypothetical protein EEB19_01325 [Gordonia sp. OPL2]